MITIHHQITIDRPVDEVFNYVTDSRNDPEWCPPVLEIEQLTKTGPEIGAKYSMVVKPGPKQAEGSFEITDLDRNSHAVYKGENDMVRFKYSYRFSENENSTTIRMTSEVDPKGVWKLFTPIIRSSSRKVAAEEFTNLKELLEQQR